MRNIKNILFIALSSLLVVSCDNFLTTIPESDYSASGAYQSESDFEYAIAAVYAAQQVHFTNPSNLFFKMSERSDDIRYDSNMQYHQLGLFIDGDDQPIAGSWESLWKMINRSNFILDRIEKADLPNEKVKDYIKGEAYGLRAWAYYTLAKVFGGMPLIDNSSMTVDEIMLIARSSQQETFDFSEDSYLKAIELLPENWNSENLGRMTKYAAEAGLARLYMFESEFAKAKPLLHSIINSGLYKMADKYENCFNDKYDNDPKQDRLWEIQFTEGELGEGQSLSGLLLYGDGGGLLPYIQNLEAPKVSQNMVGAYELGDLRKDQSIVTGLARGGVVDSTYYYIRKYAHYNYSPKSSGDWANNIPIIRYTDVKLMLAEILNEEGYVSEGEAFNILNEVRVRAGLDRLTFADIPDQVAFREALIQERRVEFAFEGLRWHDLVRWGIAEKVMNKHFKHVDEGNGRYFMDGDYREIFAIPFDEMSRYNNINIMWQNPGY